MLPWVKCALKADCISPPGSKHHGCDFERRPTFLYSGCHRYEMSIFSILVSILYNFDSTKYSMTKNNIISTMGISNHGLENLKQVSISLCLDNYPI